MLGEIKKRLFTELFGSPITLIPFFGGITSVIGGWAVGSVSLAFGGLIASLFGVGVFATRFVFGLEDLTEKVVKDIIREKEEEKEKRIKDLRFNLNRNADKSLSDCFDKLIELRKTFVEKSKGDVLNDGVIESFQKLFEACIDKIESIRHVPTERAKNGKITIKSRDKRELLIKEVADTIVYLTGFVDKFEEKKESNLESLKDELEINLEIAKQVAEEFSESGLKRELE